MIEWHGLLLNAIEIQAVLFDEYYSDLYDVAYNSGIDSAFIWLKGKKKPLIIACNKNQFSELKKQLTSVLPSA